MVEITRLIQEAEEVKVQQPLQTQQEINDKTEELTAIRDQLSRD